MQHGRTFRHALLGLTILCASAAYGPPAGAAPPEPAGQFGAFLRARLAAAHMEFAPAAESFLAVLKDDAGDAEMIREAFISCVMSDRPEAARLARKLPNSHLAQLYLADLDAAAGDWGAAERRFAALPPSGMTQLLQPMLVAWAQAGQGRTEAAVATLRRAMEDGKNTGIYALHAAVIADLGGRTAEAGQLYRQATSRGAPNLRQAQFLASWHARQGRPGEANRILRALVRDDDELDVALPGLGRAGQARPVANARDGIAEAYLALAAALRQQDQTDQALLLLHFAVALRPDFTAARLLASDVEESEQRPKAALAMLAGVPATDPLAPVVRLRRAALLDRTGDVDGALREYEALARDFPARPEAFAGMADTLRTHGRFADAISAYDRAIARVKHAEPADWALFYGRGLAYDMAHQWPRAEADFLQALELAPDQAVALNYLGYSWVEQGRNLARAQEMIERAVQVRPDDANFLDSLGWVKLRRGDQAGAIRDLERAAEITPEDATVNEHLGDAYWDAGRGREAEFQWRRALNLHPNPRDVAKLEAKLEAGTRAEVPAAVAQHGAANVPRIMPAEHRLQ